MTAVSSLEQVEVSADPLAAAAGRNPWVLAGRRLLRNRIALAALGLFVLIVVVSPGRRCMRATSRTWTRSRRT